MDSKVFLLMSPAPCTWIAGPGYTARRRKFFANDGKAFLTSYQRAVPSLLVLRVAG